MLLIRADANTSIGTGHVMRCLALAEAWQDSGGDVTFLASIDAPAIEAKLKSEGMELRRPKSTSGSIEDAAGTVSLSRMKDVQWVVVDGYHFCSDYQKFLKDAKLNILTIDDMNYTNNYSADIILNQNIHAHRSLYRNKAPYTRLLLGTNYALLRREFLKYRGWMRTHSNEAHKILVTLGGSDPDNVSLKVINALKQLDIADMEYKIVIGPANLNIEYLRQSIEGASQRFELLTDISNMSELMAWADISVSAGGSTCWELAFMGLPNLILILADNQKEIANGLDSAEVAINVGWHSSVSSNVLANALLNLIQNPEERGRMSERGRKLVDGLGASKVISTMKEISS